MDHVDHQQTVAAPWQFVDHVDHQLMGAKSRGQVDNVDNVDHLQNGAMPRGQMDAKSVDHFVDACGP